VPGKKFTPNQGPVIAEADKREAGGEGSCLTEKRKKMSVD